MLAKHTLKQYLITLPLILTFVISATAQPPVSRQELVEDNYFGTIVKDYFRWLEGGALIEDENIAGKLETEIALWTDKQNKYTRSMLDKLATRDQLEKRISELMTVESIGTPRMYGKYYFNHQRKGDQNQSVLYIRDSLNAAPRILLDPNKLDDEGLTSLDWYTPNKDGTLMAFGLSYAGNEMAVLYIMDVHSGEWLADEIPNDVGNVSWLPDSSGFLYKRRKDIDDPYSAQIMFHVVGTHYTQDKLLFEQYDETWGPSAYLSRDGRWMILIYWTGTDSNDLWVVDFDKWRRTGEFKTVTIIKGEKAIFTGSVYGDILYMKTTLDASNGCVYAVNLNNPSRENWKIVIPQRKDAVLERISTARGMLVVTYEYKAHTIVSRFDLEGNPLGDLTLPGIGSGYVVTNPDRTEAFLSYSSYNEPPSIYQIDLVKDTNKLWARPDIPVDPSIIEVKQITYKSQDGTPVTMFIIHKKGMKLDGNNPTLLSGYGGFNISITPWFSKTLFPWYEAGGVYALPNLRGGGEYGHDWHRDGMLENKQNVFDDFIAAAEWLIDNKYTNPDKLAISGGSNGGLLVGAAVMQRPDLFKAVVCTVPLLDMLRYQKFLMAKYWVPEYGSSENEEQFDFLYAYSPYHNIDQNTKYPAMFITAGENDARVHPSHARKMTAALQSLPTADHQNRPVLLWVDREAGHGGGKPLRNVIRDIVDERIFVMWQLGMLK